MSLLLVIAHTPWFPVSFLFIHKYASRANLTSFASCYNLSFPPLVSCFLTASCFKRFICPKLKGGVLGLILFSQLSESRVTALKSLESQVPNQREREKNQAPVQMSKIINMWDFVRSVSLLRCLWGLDLTGLEAETSPGVSAAPVKLMEWHQFMPAEDPAYDH